MKEQQIFLGTSVFPMAWILWNSPASKWSKDYEIKKNRSRDLQKTLITLNKNALIHLAKLIDNPDSTEACACATIANIPLPPPPRQKNKTKQNKRHVTYHVSLFI